MKRPTMNIAPWRVLAAVAMLANAAPVFAQMHAASTLPLKLPISVCAPDYAAADANLTRNSKYRYTHEALYSNYTYGNAGSGHAHYHTGTCLSYDLIAAADSPGDFPVPTLGAPGTAQYILQTWLPNATGDGFNVVWSPDSFLQVDLSELALDNTLANPLAARASLATSTGLAGSVELLAWLDATLTPQTATHFTGAFDGLANQLRAWPGNVVSLQFTDPLNWNVVGDLSTFEIALEGSIDGVQVIPEPGSGLLFAGGLAGWTLLKKMRCGRRGVA